MLKYYIISLTFYGRESWTISWTMKWRLPVTEMEISGNREVILENKAENIVDGTWTKRGKCKEKWEQRIYLYLEKDS